MYLLLCLVSFLRGGGGVEGVVLWHISYSDETLRHSLPQERIFFSFDPMALPYSN